VWNEAVDFAVNQMLTDFGMPMPPDGLLNPSFRGMTAERIYDQLAAQRGRLKVSPARGKSGVPDGRGVEHSAGGSGSRHRGFDVHLASTDARGGRHRTAEFPTQLERARLRDALTQEMRLRGSLPGSMSEEIRAEGTARVPWESFLARFVSGLRYGDYRLYPLNRKHIWRGLFLPSPGAPGPSHIVVAVDTSGSMPVSDIGRILTEIDALRAASECRLTLLQFDAVVQKVEVYEAFEEPGFSRSGSRRWSVVGRGGTRFEPVFEWLATREAKGEAYPDALIVCTDGEGSFPSAQPPYPVLWISTLVHARAFPFGECVSLQG
jgi:predicted metal-dependent peptidase